MKLQALIAVIGLTFLSVVASAPSFARTRAQIDASADKALAHFYALNPKHKELADKAVGMLIFGRVTKGGAGVAGEFGEGALRVNGATVGYYSVASGSVGLTLGVARHSEVILFMTQESLEKFRKSEDWSVGADTSFALVSKGAGGQYDTATLNRPILGFIFGEKGLLGDLSFEGSKITKVKTTD
ncbi:MAG TPA: YSC84-related protein [Steroidobacteraceae bacterium]|nr:YSC84-related protein [Steroidobacteraceae bacterium]